MILSSNNNQMLHNYKKCGTRKNDKRYSSKHMTLEAEFHYAEYWNKGHYDKFHYADCCGANVPLQRKDWATYLKKVAEFKILDEKMKCLWSSLWLYKTCQNIFEYKFKNYVKWKHRGQCYKTYHKKTLLTSLNRIYYWWYFG